MKLLFALLLPLVAIAQTSVVNPGFEEGVPGQAPDGWFVPTNGYRAELRREGCSQGSGCAVIQTASTAPAQPFGNLMQAFAAEPFRGKAIRLRAMVRVEKADPADRAQMWLRVDRPNRVMGLFDNMGNRPITSAEWRSYEIGGDIDSDALSINVGFMMFGKGKVWVDGVTFEVVTAAPPTAEETAARDDLQKIYARLNAAIQSGKFDEFSAIALPEAEVVNGPLRMPFAAAMNEMKEDVDKGSRYQMRTEVKSVRRDGDEYLVGIEETTSRTTAEGSQDYISTSRDTWIKTAAGWRLKQSSPLTTRAVAPKFDPEAVKPVVEELKQRAAPLTTVAAGAPMQDLAAFGKAVGNARIVALGEASHGTREFFQMKHRLLEYLVKEKGFTVFAIEANWPETLAVDRYIKAGEGDVATAMSRMYFWTWYTEEVRDMIEWMRGFNSAPGTHPTLTFTAFDMQTGTVAAQNVLDYLKKYSPDNLPAGEAAYQDIAGLNLNDNRAQQFADRAAAILELLDTKRDGLAKASSPAAWRDARQAANVAYQACVMRIPGKSSLYRDEMMAANVDWLLKEVHPKEKIVLWAHNGHVGFGADMGSKRMGSWLRERFGKDMYVLGFAFRTGSLRAVGGTMGAMTALAEHKVPPAPEGSGSAVLGLAGMPLYFVDLAGLPSGGALAKYVGQSHLFYDVGALWNSDPQSNLAPETLKNSYDGIIFVDEGHAAQPLPARR